MRRALIEAFPDVRLVLASKPNLGVEGDERVLEVDVSVGERTERVHSSLETGEWPRSRDVVAKVRALVAEEADDVQ